MKGIDASWPRANFTCALCEGCGLSHVGAGDCHSCLGAGFLSEAGGLELFRRLAGSVSPREFASRLRQYAERLHDQEHAMRTHGCHREADATSQERVSIEACARALVAVLDHSPRPEAPGAYRPHGEPAGWVRRVVRWMIGKAA